MDKALDHRSLGHGIGVRHGLIFTGSWSRGKAWINFHWVMVYGVRHGLIFTGSWSRGKVWINFSLGHVLGVIDHHRSLDCGLGVIDHHISLDCGLWVRHWILSRGVETMHWNGS